MMLLFLAPKAFGDRGELYLDAGTKLGYLWAQNPIVQNGRYSAGFLEDFNLGLRYGLSDRVHLGFAVQVSSSFFGLASSGAKVSQINGDLSSDIVGLYVPIIISYRINNGYDWSTLLELQFGYAGFSWNNKALTGKGTILFSDSELEQPWQNGMAGGLNILVQGRFTDWFALEFGPSMNVAYMSPDSLAFYPGLLIRSAFIFGVGGGL